jgi:hypothetical protein
MRSCLSGLVGILIAFVAFQQEHASAQTVETVSSHVMPDGTIFDVPNNYGYEWFKEGGTFKTTGMSLLLKLPELQPQNVKTWEGLHWGTGDDAAALRITVRWHEDISEYFSAIEKNALSEISGFKDYATQVHDPDNSLVYTFNWTTPRGNSRPRPRERQVFDVVYLNMGAPGLTRYMHCSPMTQLARPKASCSLVFRYENLEVRAHFLRKYFANWKVYEETIHRMLDRFERKH